MADYYSLLAKAVANLPKGSPAPARKVIYDRARKALLGQLRALGSALSEADIAREEAALEAAVARLEGQFAPPPPPPPAAPASRPAETLARAPISAATAKPQAPAAPPAATAPAHPPLGAASEPPPARPAAPRAPVAPPTGAAARPSIGVAASTRAIAGARPAPVAPPLAPSRGRGP